MYVCLRVASVRHLRGNPHRELQEFCHSGQPMLFEEWQIDSCNHLSLALQSSWEKLLSRWRTGTVTFRYMKLPLRVVVFFFTFLPPPLGVNQKKVHVSFTSFRSFHSISCRWRIERAKRKKKWLRSRKLMADECASLEQTVFSKAEEEMLARHSN